MNKYILLLAVAFTISGCSHESEVEISEPTAEGDWTSIQLVDVATGESFSIEQFEKPTLIQSFAVWCPSCKKQQDEIKILFEEVGDDIVFVSLDTDPNENEENIKEHIEQYDFNWYYAISPVPLTQELIDLFGVNVVNAPSDPMILVCNDQAVLLDSGLKDADTLKSHVEDKCS